MDSPWTPTFSGGLLPAHHPISRRASAAAFVRVSKGGRLGNGVGEGKDGMSESCPPCRKSPWSRGASLLSSLCGGCMCIVCTIHIFVVSSGLSERDWMIGLLLWVLTRLGDLCECLAIAGSLGWDSFFGIDARSTVRRTWGIIFFSLLS